MLKKLLLTTALSGLMLSSAMAQATSPSGSGSSSAPAASPGSSTPPAASSGSTSAPAASKDASKSTTSAATGAGSASTISSQSADQMLASKVRGADVMGSNDEKIGDVSDILFSKDGKVEAYVLSVGGFLGVGAKEVALAPSSVQLTQDKNDWKLKVSMNKDQLTQAPSFERYQDRTTGASSAGGGMGSGSATKPRNAPAGGNSAPAK